MNEAKLVPGLDMAHHQRHFLHGETRIWGETNCYVDLWIETLHALKLDPVAGLAFCVATDVEGDQWTFFKYPIADLEPLYGLEIIELNIWRALPEQLREQLTMGRAPIVELDAFFLPDTAGVSYRSAHVKTSVVVESIDLVARRMSYFHNAGYFSLEGEDFDAIFRLGAHASASHLPPYVEVAKLGQRPAPMGGHQVALAMAQLHLHLARRPAKNPFLTYRERFDRDLAWLKTADMHTFHGYAFSNLRQFGASFELLGTFARWLAEREQQRSEPLLRSAIDFEEIASTAKSMQFKLARVMSGKTVDFAPMLDTLTTAWDRGVSTLEAAITA